MTALIVSFAAGVSFVHSHSDASQQLEFDKGQTIYAEQCSRCHGDQGQGTEHFEDRLEGDLSISELSELIDSTMPEEKPDLCRGDDAKSVATYIYKQFYSDSSYNRTKNARVELHRRTVRQYRQSVADLIGSFNETQRIMQAEKGLKAEYFAWDRRREDRRLSTQTDPNIDYPADRGGIQHFRSDNKYEGVKAVKRRNEMGKGFCVYWTGGLIVDQTGEYEILVKCPNGFKLFLNDKEKPLIDQWVRSGDELEHRARIFLVEGRSYYLHLHVFAYKDKSVAAQLLWQPPGRPMQIIPTTAYVSSQPSEVSVVSTSFPADDASWGYERGNSVSRQWHDATTNAAIQTAKWVAARIVQLSNSRSSKNDRQEKVMAFCRQFVERAFVDQLNDKDYQFYVGQHFENDLSLKDQVKRVVLLTLKSPRFLYPELAKRNESSTIAERLARVMWDSLPDNQLMKAADSDDLLQSESIDRELNRMLSDYRTKSKLKSFFSKWLMLDSFEDISKDKDLFPNFDEQIMSDLRTSLELQLDDVVWNGSANYQKLFLGQQFYVNFRLAEFFGIDAELTPGEFTPVTFESNVRSGVVTHPFLLSGLAYHKKSSPIHRGVFVARNLIGRRLRQPPDDVEPLSEEFGPDMTTREIVEHQTKEVACMNCHQIINPLGFSFENFDAVGKYREKEKGQPINVESDYELPDGSIIRLNGPNETANFLANNEQTQRNFIRQLFHYFTKQSIYAYGPDTLDVLHERFRASDYNIKTLLIEIAKIVIEYKQPLSSQ